MHLNSSLVFEKYAKEYFKSNMKILEIGPDGFPSTYNKIVNNRAVKWETLDINKIQQLTYVADDPYKFPIPDNTFDIIVSGQVIEHVKKIWVWMKEVSRVCKEGGHVITIAPVSWVFHEFPVDCWRIYPEGMNTLYEEAGLKMQLCKFESLEIPRHRRVIPGNGAQEFKKDLSLRSLIKDLVRWPTTCSYDTIAIGTKTKT